MKNRTNNRKRSVIFMIAIAASLSLLSTTSFSSKLVSIGRAISSPGSVRKTYAIQAGDHPTVQAAGRGAPFVNFHDGEMVSTTYSGEDGMIRALTGARPLALASADFDEDGVPDLISVYSGSKGGLVTVHRGNVDSIYPNAPEAIERKEKGAFVDSPFYPSAQVFELPEAANFIGAGDFDADSHWDIVATASGSNTLYLLRGDGHGGLGKAERLELPGRVTTMITGEVNRADGLDDIAVGIVGANGPQALVFESPKGAFAAKPEAFQLPAEAKSMAVGLLDDSYEMDLAIAAGSELLIVRGRDRKLSLDEIRRATVQPASTYTRSFQFGLKSLAVGDFKGEQRFDIAALLDDGSIQVVSERKTEGKEAWTTEALASGAYPRATELRRVKVSTRQGDDLVVLDPTNHQLHITLGKAAPDTKSKSSKSQAQAAQEDSPISFDVEGEPAAMLPMRLNRDAMNDLVILEAGKSAPTALMTTVGRVFTVTNVNDSGVGSLRQAIMDANANAGMDAIDFDFVGSPFTTQTITLSSVLPTLTEAVLIDGTTSLAGQVELNGNASSASAADGLTIAGGSSTVRGMVINRCGDDGVQLASSNNIVEGNKLGTNQNASAAGPGNFGHGVRCSSVINNRIGGTTLAARNIISGNLIDGVIITGGAAEMNRVLGNFIGMNANGAGTTGNLIAGVTINNAPNNTVGGTVAGVRNVISGSSVGLFIGGLFATGNLIQGNFIGTNANGTAAPGNFNSGVQISDGNTNTIGGTIGAARNLISGNGIGIAVAGPSASNNLVQGNFIGTDADGDSALANFVFGVSLSSPNNTIGGAVAGALNVISGTTNEAGIHIQGTENVIQGNFIGTNADGTAALGNGGDGVRIDHASSNLIGGAEPAARNVISGNLGSGIAIEGVPGAGNDNVIQGNYIGTDVNGIADLGNSSGGVNISNASNSIIGGSMAGEGNIISGNNQDGVQIESGTGTRIQGNYIGTDKFGAAALGNNVNGVRTLASNNTTIGGAVAGEGNLISGNGLHGVLIESGSGNLVQGNYVGTDKNGSAALGNLSDGVFLLFASNNTIGGTIGAARNLISGNGTNGVHILDASGNLVQGNYIGTDKNGAAALGNADGVRLDAASNNTIGGAAGNVIAFNRENGVSLQGGFGIRISANSIFENIGLGIDLGLGGVTQNDLGDPDTGSNNLQNYPIINSASISFFSTTVQGVINSTPGRTFTIEIFSNSSSCDSSGNGEGRTFIGSVTTPMSDANGNAGFIVTSPVLISSGHLLTATATDNTTHDTSEFSSCFLPVNADLAAAISAAPTTAIAGADITYTIAVTNRGPDAATNLALQESTPLNTTFQSITAPPGWNCTAPLVGLTGSVTCTKASLASGATDTITLVVRLNPAAPAGQTIINSATVLSQAGDPDTNNNTATVQTEVSRIADLEITGSASPNPVAPGSNITYSFTVTNNGPSTANTITLSEATPANTTFQSITAAAGWNCTAPQVGGTGSITCTNPLVNAGQTFSFSVVVRVNAGTPLGTVITSVASVGSAITPDPDPSNNSKPANTLVDLPSFIVTNTDDNGLGSLRDAINQSNSTTGMERIRFLIPESVPNEVFRILLNSALPTITNPVIIDGYTQPGASPNTRTDIDNAVLKIVLDGALTNDASGLRITAGNCTVRGLAINRFKNSSASFGAIDIRTGGGNIIEGNFIGTDSTGLAALGDTQNGVTITRSSDNRIGGVTRAARNLISGNAGAAALGNTAGGITLTGGPDTHGNLVQGNFIGINAAGTAALGNAQGVFIEQSSNNTIGGTTSDARNVISGNNSASNSNGITLSGPHSGILVQGNYIGTNATGTAAVPNRRGINTNGFPTTNITIGGLTPTPGTAPGNVISGNILEGINLDGSASGDISNSKIQGNLIGTDASGTQDLGNGGIGVSLGRANTIQIGGTTAQERNVISGNEGSNVRIFGGSATSALNKVQGNYLGTGINGTETIGNGNASQNIPNIEVQAGNNTIGGATPGAGNIIAFSKGGAGVDLLNAAVRVTIRGNSIFGNARQGIDLRDLGNDHCDADSGSNNAQNHPALTSATSSVGDTVIQGSLDSQGGLSYTIDFYASDDCDPSGFGEGKTFIGSTQVTTAPASCLGNINVTLPVDTGGKYITATATDEIGNTSEFSQCVANPCLMPTSAAVTTAGGAGAVHLLAPVGYNWTAISNDGWITLTSPAAGSGNGEITYEIRENGNERFRIGTITIAGQTFTVQQAGTGEGECTILISPMFVSISNMGGSGSINVVTPEECTWSAKSNAGWITITSGYSGNGVGTVTFSVEPNISGATRAGTITIGDRTFNVKQKQSAWEFIKIVDSTTPIPGGTGNFQAIGSPVMSGGSVAFNGGSGIYARNVVGNGPLVALVDRTTPVPGGAGTFSGVSGTPGFDHGDVAFRAGGGMYIVLSSGQGYKVADTNTQMPGETVNFTSFGDPWLYEGRVVFRGLGTGKDGIYTAIAGGTLQKVADKNTPIPNGTGNFTDFGDIFSGLVAGIPTVDDETVVFRGRGASGQDGVYMSDGSGALHVVADKNTPIPNGTGNFTGFSQSILSGVIKDGKVAFVGQGSGGQLGIYRWENGQLFVIIDRNTPIAGAPGVFLTGFGGQGFGWDGEQGVSVLGDTPSTQGIYTTYGGSLQKAVQNLDVLDGKVSSGFGHYGQGLDGNRVSFLVGSFGCPPGSPICEMAIFVARLGN